MLWALVCVYCCSMTHYVKAASELMLRAEWRSRLGVLLLFAFTFYGQAAVCFMTRLHLCINWSLPSAILFCFGPLCNNRTAMLAADRPRLSSASFWKPFCCFQKIDYCSVSFCNQSQLTIFTLWFSLFCIWILQIWTNCHHPQQLLDCSLLWKGSIVCPCHMQLRWFKGMRYVDETTLLMSHAQHSWLKFWAPSLFGCQSLVFPVELCSFKAFPAQQ